MTRITALLQWASEHLWWTAFGMAVLWAVVYALLRRSSKRQIARTELRIRTRGNERDWKSTVYNPKEYRSRRRN